MGNSGSNVRSEGRPTSSGGFTPLTPSRRPGNILVTTTHQPQAQTPPLSPTIESPDAKVPALASLGKTEDPKADSGGHADKDGGKGGGEGNVDGKARERLAESEDTLAAESDTSQDKGESRKLWRCQHHDLFFFGRSLLTAWTFMKHKRASAWFRICSSRYRINMPCNTTCTLFLFLLRRSNLFCKKDISC
jgi:hypothetical protein